MRLSMSQFMTGFGHLASLSPANVWDDALILHWQSWTKECDPVPQRLMQHSHYPVNYVCCLYICNSLIPHSPHSLSGCVLFWANYSQTCPVESPSSLPVSGSSAGFSSVRSWGRFQVSRAADQQPFIYTDLQADRLSLNWADECRRGGWRDYHSSGGSGAGSHSPHRPADSLNGCRGRWVTSLRALPCWPSRCFTGWLSSWPTNCVTAKYN